MANLVIPDGGNIGSASDTDAISIASDGNISLGAGIVSGNFGTITQRSSSSSSPTFTRSSGVAIDSSVLADLYGSTNVQPNGTTATTHGWIAWDYGSGNARKLTKLQWHQVDGTSNSTGIFLEGSNVDSPNASAGHSDWTQLKSFGNIVNGTVYSYSSPVTATTLKYRHYRIRYSWSSGSYNSIHSFVLEDTDSTFDARTALNATGDAPIYACRAWVNFNGNDISTNTVVIRGSGNVSSITDNGVGLYTINFSTAMPDTNYSISYWLRSDIATPSAGHTLNAGLNYTKTTSAFAIITRYIAGGSTGVIDHPEICINIFR